MALFFNTLFNVLYASNRHLLVYYILFTIVKFHKACFYTCLYSDLEQVCRLCTLVCRLCTQNNGEARVAQAVARCASHY